MTLPKCIDIFYNHLLSNPLNPKAAELIKEAFHDDWNTRPNPLDPVGGGKYGDNWPGSSALTMVLGMWGVQIKDLKFEIMVHADCGNGKHALVSKCSGTCTGETPEGMPHFLGLDPDVIKGKSFVAIAIDLQIVVDGKIKQAYHCEDWSDVASQIAGGRTAPTVLDHVDYDKAGATLTEVRGACVGGRVGGAPGREECCRTTTLSK